MALVYSGANVKLLLIIISVLFKEEERLNNENNISGVCPIKALTLVLCCFNN